MKGQDLIQSARAKNVTSTFNQWNALTWAFMDRTVRFPGDDARDSIIENISATEQTATTSAIGDLALGMVGGGGSAAMVDSPQNPIITGGSFFWVYIGHDNTGAAINKNVIVLCRSTDCATAFTNDQLAITFERRYGDRRPC